MSSTGWVSVADLHAQLAQLVACGRGGDEVTFGWTDAAEAAISEQTREQLQRSDWSLRAVTWSDDADHFTTLQFEPRNHPIVRSSHIRGEEHAP